MRCRLYFSTSTPRPAFTFRSLTHAFPVCFSIMTSEGDELRLNLQHPLVDPYRTYRSYLSTSSMRGNNSGRFKGHTIAICCHCVGLSRHLQEHKRSVSVGAVTDQPLRVIS